MPTAAQRGRMANLTTRPAILPNDAILAILT